MKCRRILAVSLTLIFSAAAARADNWPQWRGPNADGASSEKNLSAKWDLKKNLAWKAPLPGMGGSTPIIWGDNIFLTSEDGDDVALICLNTAGKQLWKTGLGLGTGKRRFMKDEANQASASPCTDGKHVFAFFGTGDFYYESIHPSRYRSSPVLADGKLFLAARDGTVTVVKAGSKFELLAVDEFDDLITASPAIANGRIYIRGFKALYAISQDGK